jgi:hypothetical protein
MVKLHGRSPHSFLVIAEIFFRSSGPKQLRQVVLQQVANAPEADVRCRIVCQNLRVGGVMTLSDKNGGDTGAPDFLHGGQEAR